MADGGLTGLEERVQISWAMTSGMILSQKTVIYRLKINILFLAKGSHLKNKIEIRPIDALLEVLGFTTFSIYLVFQFE